MILTDTSVWIDHFRAGNRRLAALLETEEIIMHPFVLGEIACGNLKNRQEIIALLHALPFAQKADDDEVLFFIDRHKLNGRGIGLIDAHLLASCFISGHSLWTADKKLRTIAKELGVSDSSAE